MGTHSGLVRTSRCEQAFECDGNKVKINWWFWFRGPKRLPMSLVEHKFQVDYYYQKLAQNTKETNGSTTSNSWFNYSHACNWVIMSFFHPHVHSICMRCINWPSMKWTTLHASNYHMGWILVQNCVRPCTRVCVRGNECVRGVHAHLRFVHVPLVWLREDEYILLEPASRHCDQSTQGCRDNASTCATWLHEL